MVRCTGCGVLSLHPLPTDGELGPFYAAEYYGSDRKKFIGPVARFVGYFQRGRARMVSSRVPKGGKVLDIGCGNGGFLAQMKELGYQVEGTEWTRASASRVPAGIPVHVGDLLSLKLPEASDDAISMWHVLEHVRDPHATISRIQRLLKPGGHLFLALPNAESRQADKFGQAWFHHDPPRHLYGFGPNSLGMLLKQAGFTLERVSTSSLEQNPYGFIQSFLNARGYPRDRAYGVLKRTSRERAGTRFGDLVRVALLTPPALLVSTIESMRGRGATMTLIARKA
jgi:SAM-dependent methyltransferase